MIAYLVAFLIAFALPASANPVPEIIAGGSQTNGMAELVGCSDLPNVFEIHTAYEVATPAAHVWTGEDWSTSWDVNSSGFPGWTPWKDSLATVEIDESGTRSWHGKGVEAVSVQCRDYVAPLTVAVCDHPAGTTTPDCTFGWYIGETVGYHPHVRVGYDADVNRDNVVGSLDYTIAYSCYGQAPAACVFQGTPYPTADVNNDGVIGNADLIRINQNFGRSLSSYQHLGHVQRYYTDRKPCPPGLGCGWVPGSPTAHVWFQPAE